MDRNEYALDLSDSSALQERPTSDICVRVPSGTCMHLEVTTARLRRESEHNGEDAQSQR
jgi:hypothetical protein